MLCDCLAMGFLLHIGSTILCPHAGQVYSITTNARAFVSGQAIVTQTDTFNITACPFTLPSGTPHPCILTKWLGPSIHILVNGKPAVLQESTSICQSADQSPQGPANVVATQARVRGL
jgi:hypothetical protein